MKLLEAAFIEAVGVLLLVLSRELYYAWCGERTFDVSKLFGRVIVCEKNLLRVFVCACLIVIFSFFSGIKLFFATIDCVAARRF